MLKAAWIALSVMVILFLALMTLLFCWSASMMSEDEDFDGQ